MANSKVSWLSQGSPSGGSALASIVVENRYGIQIFIIRFSVTTADIPTSITFGFTKSIRSSNKALLASADVKMYVLSKAVTNIGKLPTFSRVYT